MCSHIPNTGEQMVRYHGYYSNVSRGKRKEIEDDGVPCILEANKSSKEYRKNWARLIQKIKGVDPLTCTKCRGTMRIISFIEDREVIQTILKHLGLWLVKSRPTPKAHAPPAGYIRDLFSQLPMNDGHLYGDPTTPGMLIFSRKDQEYGGEEEPVCPDEPQKKPAGPRQIVESAPSPSTPKIPRNPAEKAPQQAQDLVLQFP